MPVAWGAEKKIKNITFSITDECNLRCTYCYFTHKNHKNKMTFDIAKKAVDDILSDPSNEIFDGVIWEFIGGEPTLEMQLIDEISDYILYKMYEKEHKWLFCYRFMIGTNGLLYGSKEFQKYIRKHRGNLSVAITIDGTKEKHDLSRIKKDGSGSYDEVKKVIPLWRKQFGADSTKATFSHDDLPYLKDSIINLWNMGIKCVAANIVFEEVWQDGDVEIYKQQLYELANYIIENDLWDKYSVRFFDPNVGTPNTFENMHRNVCGTGVMMAINTNGDYYPCVRFMPSATNNHTFTKLGSISEKISPDKLRAFSILSTKNQSPQKCLECDIAGGCGWCSGHNYDCSSIGTLFERQTFLCEMHKANVEVNKYLWRQYEIIKQRISPYRYKKITTISPFNKYLYIICDSEFPSHCEYTNCQSSLESKSHIYMEKSVVEKVIEYCDNNNFVPVFCGCSSLPDNYYGHQIITYTDLITEKCHIHENYFTQILINIKQINKETNLFGVRDIILTAKASQMRELYDGIEFITSMNFHLNINLAINEMDIDEKEYIRNYKIFLDKLLTLTKIHWNNEDYLNVNIITSEIFANTIRPCGGGFNSYAISPEGKFYICAGFYKLFPDQNIGTIDTGINNKYIEYCDPRKGPLCSECNVRHCRRCVLKNICGTGEYHLPTELQCVLSHIEYEFSRKLSEMINCGEITFPYKYNHRLVKNEHFDPVKKLRGESYPNMGFDDVAKELKI